MGSYFGRQRFQLKDEDFESIQARHFHPISAENKK